MVAVRSGWGTIGEEDRLVSSVPELQLLEDLAKLLRKHGPDAFERLARQLERPEFVEHFRQALSAAARVARQSGVTGPHSRSSGPSPRNYRLSLLNQGPAGDEKCALLVRLYDQLMAKALLPRMSDLRAFAHDAGLPSLQAAARPRVITEIFENLRGRLLEELRHLESQLPARERPDDRSLENWTQVIFDKELGKKKAE
jgi:hypothetical protein